MKLKPLFDKVKAVAAKKHLKRDELCKALRMSLHTYLILENGEFEKSIPKMSKRQVMSNAVVIAKLCAFTEELPLKWFQELFPALGDMEAQSAIKKAQELADEVSGSETELTVEDLDFLKMMMGQSTTPITFGDAYSLLCRYRSKR